MNENITIQENLILELSAKLRDESAEWKYHNELVHLKKDAEWLNRREQQLKNQIKYSKSKTERLWEITGNCSRAAMRRAPWKPNILCCTSPPPGWENATKMGTLCLESIYQLRGLEKQLAVVKEKQRDIRKEKVRRMIDTFKSPDNHSH